MTVSAPLPRQPLANGEAGEGEVKPRCDVCGHHLADHDPIGLRYCQATQAQALHRNCICRDP
jgi:hypothetical protein